MKPVKGLRKKPLILSLLLLTSLLLSLAYVSSLYEHHLYAETRMNAQTLLYVKGGRLNDTLKERILLLDSIQAFINSGIENHELRTQFNLFAEGLMASKPEIRALQIFPPQGPMFLYPRAGNEQVQNRHLTDLVNDERPAVRDAVAQTIATGEIVLSEPYELLQGGLGVVARKALYSQGALWGVASVVIDLPPLFAMAELEMHGRTLHYHLKDHHKNLLFGTSDHMTDPLIYQVRLPGQNWEVTAEPPGGWKSGYRYTLQIFQILGIILSAFVSTLGYVLLTQRVNLEKQVREQTREIRESEYLLKKAQTVARFGSWQIDVATEIITCSEEAFRLLGIDDDEVRFSYQTFLDTLHPKDRNDLDQEFTRTLASEAGVFEHRCRIMGTGGNAPRLVVIRCDIHRDAGGRALEAIGIIQDITEQTAASAERDRLASAIEQIDEMVVIIDLDQRILYVNPAFEKVTGYSREEALGQPASILKSGAHTEQFYDAVWETLNREESWSGRFINRKKDGTLYTDETTISPVFDSRGRVVNYVEIKRDITADLEMQGRLAQSDKEESLGRLAGGIAHDLNNLLAPILGYSEILSSQEEIPAPLIKMIRNIHQAGIRSRDLVRQLLAFSRKQSLNFQSLDLEKSLQEFLPFLRRIIREDVAIRIDAAPAVPPVRADKGQLEQVIMNLAVNAQDAMPGGGSILLKISKAAGPPAGTGKIHQGEPGEIVVLSLTDTGSGMDEETRKKVFEPFFSTKGSRGNGLGLATVYGIVKQHGGIIEMDSLPGEGTTFTIFLPAAKEEPRETSETGFTSGSLERGTETILVAEDSPQVRDLTRTILEQSGYTVISAASGEEALQRLEERGNSIALLLTDVIMPEMNGPELFRRAHQIHPDLKVLYMSGYTGNAILQHGFSEKEVHLIQKPFTLSTLTHKVREVLDGP